MSCLECGFDDDACTCKVRPLDTVGALQRRLAATGECSTLSISCVAGMWCARLTARARANGGLGAYSTHVADAASMHEALTAAFDAFWEHERPE